LHHTVSKGPFQHGLFFGSGILCGHVYLLCLNSWLFTDPAGQIEVAVHYSFLSSLFRKNTVQIQNITVLHLIIILHVWNLVCQAI